MTNIANVSGVLKKLLIVNIFRKAQQHTKLNKDSRRFIDRMKRIWLRSYVKFSQICIKYILQLSASVFIGNLYMFCIHVQTKPVSNDICYIHHWFIMYLYIYRCSRCSRCSNLKFISLGSNGWFCESISLLFYVMMLL